MPVKISLITATFNSAATLETTLKSVQSQTYPLIEYIIVDGCSTDGTLELLEQYRDGISILVSEPDKGIYDAMNKGVALATGDYIGFLHADDWFATAQTLEQLAKGMEMSAPDLIYGDLDYVEANPPHRVVRRWKSEPFEQSLLRKGWMPPHPTLYVARSIWNRVGSFDAGMRISADYDFILRVFGQPHIRTAYLPQCLVKMRLGGASNRSVSNVLLKMKEDYAALKRNHIGGFNSLMYKNIQKIPQFFRR